MRQHVYGILIGCMMLTSFWTAWGMTHRSEPPATQLTLQQSERRSTADSLPRENRIHSIRENNGEYLLVVELATEQPRLDIGVYNLLGKRVVTVYQGRAAAGVREFPIPTANLPNGIYICVVQGNGFRLAQKFVLSR